MFFPRKPLKKESDSKPKPSQPAETKKPTKDALKEAPKPAASNTYDLPPVQSKETLILGYDYNQQYTKRKVESNWSRYDESSEEEENAQLEAADFGKILSTPQSTGSYFTFASEKDWMDDTSANNSSLFKLDMTLLKNGVGKLPFHMRQGLPKDLFTADEIVNMDRCVNYMENPEYLQKRAKNEFTQNLLDVLTDKNIQKSQIDGKRLLAHIKITNDVPDKLDKSLKTLKLEDKKSSNKNSSESQSKPKDPPILTAPVPPLANTSSSSQVKSSENVKNPKVDDIQDWLDDILNES